MENTRFRLILILTNVVYNENVVFSILSIKITRLLKYMIWLYHIINLSISQETRFMTLIKSPNDCNDVTCPVFNRNIMV